MLELLLEMLEEDCKLLELLRTLLELDLTLEEDRAVFSLLELASSPLHELRSSSS